MSAKKLVAAAALGVAGVVAAAGSAAADSGPRMDDLAPHSTDDTAAVINGDTVVADLVNVNAPVNLPILGKTGAAQTGNERAAEQEDAPVVDHEHVETLLLGGLPF